MRNRKEKPLNLYIFVLSFCRFPLVFFLRIVVCVWNKRKVSMDRCRIPYLRAKTRDFIIRRTSLETRIGRLYTQGTANVEN